MEHILLTAFAIFVLWFFTLFGLGLFCLFISNMFFWIKRGKEVVEAEQEEISEGLDDPSYTVRSGKGGGVPLQPSTALLEAAPDLPPLDE